MKISDAAAEFLGDKIVHDLLSIQNRLVRSLADPLKRGVFFILPPSRFERNTYRILHRVVSTMNILPKNYQHCVCLDVIPQFYVGDLSPHPFFTYAPNVDVMRVLNPGPGHDPILDCHLNPEGNRLLANRILQIDQMMRCLKPTDPTIRDRGTKRKFEDLTASDYN